MTIALKQKRRCRCRMKVRSCVGFTVAVAWQARSLTLVSNEMVLGVFRPHMIGTDAVRLDPVCRSCAAEETPRAVRMLRRQLARLNGCRAV